MTRSARGSRRSSLHDETSSESQVSDQSTSDELNSGARIREPMRAARSQIVVEMEPEPAPEPEPPKKKSEAPKRKPVPSKKKKK